MKVKRAAKAGFCFGVKRALDMAERTSETSHAVSLGPLIHNQQVVKRLAERGIQVVEDLDELTSQQALIIRSHGVAPKVYQGAENKGIQVVDATCPFVQKAQRLAAESAKKGQQVIVMGDKHHPEVQGILGWAGEQAIPIQTVEEAKQLPFYPHLAVLAQTTQLAENFAGIVNELKSHTDNLIVHNTICNATAERQKVARELAETVDVMVVVGGRNSANTRKLASICAERTKTYLIETADELENVWFEEANGAGLTAGASTPDWIIEEVFNKMTEMNEQEMDMATWFDSCPELHQGTKVTGTVVKITREEVFVDIGWKCEGVIPINELAVSRKTRPEDAVEIGDEISAVVIRVENEEGHTVLSKRKADEEGAKDRLEKIAETKEEIQAKVVEVVKGGLVVDVGLRGFVPASQIQPGYVEDLDQFLGQTLRLRMIDYDPAKRKVVLSQKVILEEERAIKRKQLLETLKEGDVVAGTVRRMADFGVFVDIGGLDGLLHISDMAYTRLKHPSDMLKIGDEVEVQVLKLDQQTGKVSLGLKQLKESPWEKAAVNFPVGGVVNGKVVRITPFGAFVGLGEGVDGLVHISQLADHRVNKVEDVVKVGDMVSAKVIDCKPEEKRISLSIREAIAESTKEIDQEALASQSDIKPVTIGDAVGNDLPQES
ncbi:bifunctional 4-hydroxy-3-methylbut-2-enyl diphosphate reductase/30S ribosomal protein S1 [Desulfosporosinus sp.]|uniref:bifunctional 4-hydroxy-3-methylbut-2-enyl diphosphate reductase/30S ribosomal protein S1 n=1 Tax=Desulfosporosinus sp. TaxID=157907 RepID=UPI0025C635AC|nr:bifunctional 4-hydroxy-3-methylbut-2-enyl diphosphate reductase/30S ribosomal protein S1 [Desulfosporosinus sp.]MBC2721661.1 bifunctional 4-hydroxy-3-methylbut-2-enyl diphosphate reductase/30S ribosomal protein S1 [Desulfosporosinus sp.]MBC2725963.1 bifunctional 4-hydroxy-3-methylbut-2-enyl diphosphate reductase/30S ribosomal protein S1 [Desulfosporosinus sp.]